MFVNPLRGVKRKATETRHLNPSYTSPANRPRLSDGRTARRAAQSHVSVTVRYDALNNLRVKRKDLALPNAWIDNVQNAKNIEQVRRGDIVMTIQDSVSFNADTGLTNSAVCFTHLNNWSRYIPIRVVGIAENPSAGRGQSTNKDNFGNVQARGSNSIVNMGKYTLVAGDYVYALMCPEVVDIAGTIWSMNAVKGTGDGTGSHQDYNQKLVPQLIPLKHKDIKLTLENMRFEIEELIMTTWSGQANGGSAVDYWAGYYQDLKNRLEPEMVYLIPGMKQFCDLYFLLESLRRAQRDLYNGVDIVNTRSLIKVIYTKAHAAIKEFWKEAEGQLNAIANPDDLRRLAKGNGEWLVPTGIFNIRHAIKRDITSESDLTDIDVAIVPFPSNMELKEQVDKVNKSATYIDTLIKTLTYTIGWIEANDITQFMESCYVCMCTSAQAAPGHQFDMLR